MIGKHYGNCAGRGVEVKRFSVLAKRTVGNKISEPLPRHKQPVVEALGLRIIQVKGGPKLSCPIRFCGLANLLGRGDTAAEHRKMNEDVLGPTEESFNCC